jgi:hypothetical protein
MEQEKPRHPSLTNPKAMRAAASTATRAGDLAFEIFTKVNNAKDKAKKVDVLKEHDTPPLRQLLKAAFYDKITWDLPEGTPPYIENEAPAGTEHLTLLDEAKKLYLFIKGGSTIPKLRKETLFIQMLEGLHKDEAKTLIDIKEKRLNNQFKGLTESVVKEAFGWNDDFMQK